jgi:hypothetical protein
VELQFCVEGHGAIDPSALSAALAEVGQRCPGTRLVRRGRRWVDSGVPPAVTVVEPDALGRPRLDSPRLRSRLAVRDGPTCEVMLLRGTPTALVFRAHHGVMDGHGTMLWLTQVFRALRGEAVATTTSTLTVDDMLAEIAAARGCDLPPVAKAQPVKWQPLFGPLPGPPYRTLQRRRTVDGYHPAVAAKVVRAVTAYGDGTGIVLVPVDLRQFLPAMRTNGEACGSVRVDVGRDDDWSDVQANLQAALGDHQFLANRGSPVLLKLPLPWLRAAYRWLDRRFVANGEFITKSGVADYVAVVTHMGRAELADLRADGFEAAACYSLADAMLVPAIDITESGGHTDISVGWRDGPGVAEHIEALLDQIEARLG